MSKVTVYSTQTCPYCVMLTKWLKDNEVEFTEYKVDINPIAAHQMIQLSGQRGVPFTTIENDSGEMVKILGFDRSRLQEALSVGKT